MQPPPSPPSRRAVLIGLAALAACNGAPPPTPPAARTDASPLGASTRQTAIDALVRGVAWLLAQQAADGVFRSQTYGYFAKGESLTPFCLLALSQVPRKLAPIPDDVLSRGLSGALALRGPDGALGLLGPAADYPVYATAMLVRALALVRPEGWYKAAAPSLAWLRDQQLTPEEGWEGSVASGGFPMGGPLHPTPPNPGHVDLSMTRRAIEAIAGSGSPADDPSLVAARAFVGRCQVADGGFVYSPVEPALSKGLRPAGSDPSVDPGQSTGSSTCDGLLALVALGLGRSDPPVQRGLARLHALHRVDSNPGLEGGPMASFAPAMRGYWRAGASEAYARLGGPPGWREGFATAIAAEQGPDGSWRNPSQLQKEDDPLVATAFALQGLSWVLRAG
jgi:hypothetical protein